MGRKSGKSATKARTHLWTAAAVFGCALAIRFVYLHQVSKSPVFTLPLVDSNAYDAAAWQLASQGTMHIQFFWQAFFYPMFLALVYAVIGHSIVAVKIIQAVLGSALCVLVYRLGVRVFDRRTALVAAGVAVLYGPLVFFDGELLAAGWASLWAVSLILLFLAARSGRNPWICLALGLCGGLSVITHATFVPFFAVSCLWLAIVLRRASIGWRRIIAFEAIIAAGFLLVAIPVSVQCYRITGVFSPLAETGPLNLYIGNNAERSEIMAIRPGGEWEDVMLMPVREGFRTKRQAQQYFVRRVAGYVSGHPLQFAKGLARKTVHLCTTRELPNNTDEYANRAYSPLFAALMWKTHRFGFPFGVLLPFAVIGMIRRRRSIPGVIKLFVLFYAAAVILVFVTSRYRMPMIPVLAVIAAAGFWDLVDTARARRWNHLVPLVAAIVVIPAVASIGGPFGAEKVNFEAEKHHAIALYYLEHGEPKQAIEQCRTAIELDPGFSEAYQSLGTALVRAGDPVQAAVYFEKAVELKPGYFSAHNNLGTILLRQGRYEEALLHFRKALELNPVSPPILMNVAIALHMLGRHDEAGEYFRKALRNAELYNDRDIAEKIRKNFGQYVR